MPTACGRSPRTSRSPGGRATTWSWWCRPWARRPTTSSPWPTPCPAPSPGREMDMLLTVGRAQEHGPAVHGAGRPWRRGRQLHRQPGRHHHRRRPHQGQDPGGAGRPGARRRGRRQGGRRRRLPGRLHRAGDHHPRPGRLRHHGGGAGGGVQGRFLRDLHRRDRRVQRRPPHRPPGPQADPPQLRRDAGDGGQRRAGPGPALGRVRPQPRRAAARALELHLGAGHLGHLRGANDGGSDHLRRHPRRQRGQGHDRRRARPPRASRPPCSSRWPTPASTST